MDLTVLWFGIVAFLFVGYFVLDGFDFMQLFIVLSEWMGGAIATWGALMVKPEGDSVPTPLQDPTPDHHLTSL